MMESLSNMVATAGVGPSAGMCGLLLVTWDTGWHLIKRQAILQMAVLGPQVGWQD